MGTLTSRPSLASKPQSAYITHNPNSGSPSQPEDDYASLGFTPRSYTPFLQTCDQVGWALTPAQARKTRPTYTNALEIYKQHFLIAGPFYGCKLGALSKYIECARPSTQKLLPIPRDHKMHEAAFVYAMYSMQTAHQCVYNCNESAINGAIANVVQGQLQSARSSSQLRPFFSEFDVCALTYSRMKRVGIDAMQIVSLFGTLSPYKIWEKDGKMEIKIEQNETDKIISLKSVRQFFINALQHAASKNNDLTIAKAFQRHHYFSHPLFGISKSDKSPAFLIENDDSNLYSLGENNAGVNNILQFIFNCVAFGYFPCRQVVDGAGFLRPDKDKWEEFFIVKILDVSSNGEHEQEYQTWQKVPEYWDEQNNISPSSKTFLEMQGGWDAQYGFGLPNNTTWTPGQTTKTPQGKPHKPLILSAVPTTQQEIETNSTSMRGKVLTALAAAKDERDQLVGNASKLSSNNSECSWNGVFSIERVQQIQFARAFMQRNATQMNNCIEQNVNAHRIERTEGEKPYSWATDLVWHVAWTYGRWKTECGK